MASKAKKSKDAVEPEEPSETEEPISERKMFLQEEFGTVTQLLDVYLDRAKQLLQENKLQEKEAQGTQEQSQSYLSCGAKLSRDPPGMVITLKHQNCLELAQIRAQHEELVPQYAGREQEVRGTLQDTEAEASRLDKQLALLEPYKEQKVRAEQEVKALEKDLRLTRIRCAEETHGIRSRFLQDKVQCEQHFQQRMQELTWGAEEVALQALIQHVEQMKAENRLLRKLLLSLLQHCQLLRDTRTQLQDQQEQLLREIQCAQHAPLLAAPRGPRPGPPALLARPAGPLAPNHLAVPWRN